VLYEDIFRALAEKNIDYVVVGGVALVLHGVVRLTGDLDLFVKLEEPNLLKFIAAMKELGYKPKVPVKAEDLADADQRRQWRTDKGMRVFSFYNPAKPMQLVDVFIDEPIPYSKAREGKKIFEAAGIRIPVVSVEHLKALKRISARPQDLADIEALEAMEDD
jgi:hypothetical protein